MPRQTLCKCLKSKSRFIVSLCSSIGSVSDRTYPNMFKSTFLLLFSIYKATRKRISNGTQKLKKIGSLICTAHLCTSSNKLFCYYFWYIKPIEQEFWTALKSVKKGAHKWAWTGASAHSAPTWKDMKNVYMKWCHILSETSNYFNCYNYGN